MFRSRTRRKIRKALRALTNGSGTPVLTLAIFNAPTLTLIEAPAPVQIFVPALCLPNWYINKNLQRATKLTLESFIRSQEHGQLQTNSAPQNKPLKDRNLNLYYDHLHIKYNYFCQ